MIFPHSTNQSIVFGRRRCRCYRPCLSSLLNHVTYAGVDLVSPQRRSQDHLPFYPFEVGRWKILGTRLISHLLFDQFDVRVDKSVSCSSSLLSGVGLGWKTRGGHHVLTHSLRENRFICFEEFECRKTLMKALKLNWMFTIMQISL